MNHTILTPEHHKRIQLHTLLDYKKILQKSLENAKAQWESNEEPNQYVEGLLKGEFEAHRDMMLQLNSNINQLKLELDNLKST